MDKLVSLDKPLAPGEVRCVQVGEKPVAVFRVGDQHFAAVDFCPHLGGPLSEGTVEGKIVTCPWHGARFDLETGACIGGPAKRGLDCYQVDVQNFPLNPKKGIP